MNHIQKLTAELCPKGVPYVALGEVCDFQNGFAFKSSLFKDKGFPIIKITNINGVNVDLNDVKFFDPTDYKVGNPLNYSVKENDILIAMSGATTGKIGYYENEETAYLNQRVGKFIPQEDKLNNRFLYHYLLSIYDFLCSLAEGAAQPNLSSNNLKEKILIPLPPLQVQKEIVDILDKFTELQKQLKHELSLRQKQYAYYREQLLTFGDEVQWKTLGEVAEYEQPGKYLVKHTEYKDIYKTPVLTAGQTFILGYTDEEFGIYEASKKPVIIFDDFTKANKWVDFDFKAKSSAMKMITSKDESIALLKYIYYWINTLPNEKNDNDHKRQWISNYSKILIPLPPLHEQQRIVDILDRFDTLCTSLTEGLPKEIELRQKQYEYYRDLLLTFEK